MNRIYRLVWNRARCQWVAASELAGSHSRGSRTAVVATLAASLLLAHPAFAQNVGTAGGNGVGTTGGTGAGAGLAPGGGAPQFGSGQAGGNGGNGGPSPLAGGGGGGAGSGGGGGVGSNLSTGTRGFDGGIDGGAGGTDPSFGLLGGGGGGGGGTAGTFSGTQLLPGASTWTGGAGGNAAAGVGVGLGGGGGGGGGGGIGVTAQSSLAVGAGATVAGGAGGAGGAGFKGGSGGGGGAGGQGVVINAGALDNDGSIVGGNGGLGGAGSSNSVFTGPAGAQGGGGEGVLAAGGVTITNNGSISGGLSPDGTVRANAITFTGGGSTLYLNAPSAITGNVVAAGSGNTLGLRGAVDGSFDVSAIGTQYFGFDTFRKLDAVTWTLTGTGAQNWRVDGGTLAGNANSLGGSFNIGAAGTLAYDASLPGSTYSGALSGTGAFIQTGSGTLTLLGDSSAFAGATTVNGTLRIGNGTNVGALGGDITNLGAVVFDRSDDSTYGGAISGAGTLEKTGAGTLTLTGNSNSTGTTTVTAGVLQVGDGGITGALGGGDIVNNATLAFKRSDDVTVANAISGTGSLVQAGAGTTVLTGANTYGGSTTIASGTLQVGAGGASGTLGAGAVIDNAALAFNRSDAVTVANAISGTGSLTQAGSGTTVLTGANSYSGSTTVSAGVLQVGNGGGTGSLGSGAVINNGTLVFNRSGTLTVANAISGAGTLTQAGPGTTVLADDNSYSGSTTISAGTLQVGDGGSGGSLGAGGVTNNGALAFKRSDSITVANVITGTGSLTQAGAGNLVLTGANTYTGGTFVNAGTLSVNGSIVGSTTINNGGTLGGTGTVGSIAVASGGTLAPGNSIGTLSANGNLAFAPGSTYRVEANAAGASDRVNVLGAATITIAGGNVDVRAGGAGYQRNTEYTILSSGGATTGTFDGVTSNLAFLTPTLIYQGNAVLLNLQASDVLNYASVARTGNQAAVANYLGSFANAPGNATAAAVIQQIDNLTADQAASAFASMSGSPHASASQVAGALGRNFSATLAARSGFGPGGLGNAMNDWSRTHYASVNPASLDPVITSDVEMAQASPSRGVETPLAAASERGLWAQSLGAGGRLDSDGNGSGSSYRSNGFVLGYDQPVSSQWLAGGAVGYSRSWWDATSGTAASGTLESPQAGLYARYAADSWRVRLDGTYADHEFTTDRTVTIGSASSVASSSHRGQEWGVAAQVEHPMQMGDWQLKPLAGLRFARLDENGFTETGAGGADLTVADRIMQNTLLSAGMHFVRMFNQDKGGLELRAVASHLAGDNDSPVTASIAGQAGSFTADGTALKRNALTLGATVSGEFSRGVSAYLDANYEYRGSGQSAYQATAGVRASF